MRNKKKQMKQIIFLAALSTLILLQTGSITSHAQESGATSVVELSPFSQLVEYRYTTENGKVYRRLYNYYTQQWVGNWELCP